MFQHQPRVGIETEALDPFNFDPMRAVKCEWEISDGTQVVTGECKSLLRNYAKVVRGLMGGIAQDGRETLKDITGVDRNMACQSSGLSSCFQYGDDLDGMTRKAAIHIGTGSAPVTHPDYVMAAETKNTLSGSGATEASSVVFAIPTNTASEFAFSCSATINPTATETINEVGLSTRLFHTSVGNVGATAWKANYARFLMVRDIVPGGYNAVAGTPFTVKFTFRFLSTTTAFFTQMAARWFGRILQDNFGTNYYMDWTLTGSADLLSHPPATSNVIMGVTDDATTRTMSTQGLAATQLQLTGTPVVADEMTDAVRCRWNVTRSHTFSANKTINEVCLAIRNRSNFYYFAWVLAKLPSPLVVTAGNSQAFKFTFEIAV